MALDFLILYRENLREKEKEQMLWREKQLPLKFEIGAEEITLIL
jgi:hypothetical protein